MARRKTVTDEQLIAAAQDVILEQGPGASTLEIARRAGISEALLFKRFGSKEGLVTRAMCHQAPTAPWPCRLDELRGRGDVRENLTALATEMLAFYRGLAPMMMMSWSARVDTFRALGADAPPIRALKTLTNFFDAEMRAGRLRRRDPEVVARTLMGALFNFVAFELMGGNEFLPMPDATFVRGLVETLWAGLDPAHDHK